MLMVIGALNLIFGMININHVARIDLLAATMVMYGLGRIHGKIEYLKTERRLCE